MSAYTFDTYSHIKKMKETGAPEPFIEAIANMVLTLIHKSESTQKNRMIMGSTTAERKQHPYDCVFRLKPLVESFYAQYLWRTLLLFAESLPSHGDGQDFQDSTFVYKCQIWSGSPETLICPFLLQKRM
jgi:hypothetical protein